jgi:hypothetical protein
MLARLDKPLRPMRGNTAEAPLAEMSLQSLAGMSRFFR